ncbi:MAG: vanadium-dependent haloperoxidase [Beijerinckiaceae bacterium]
MKILAAAAFGSLIGLAPVCARADAVTDWNKTAIQVMKNANVSANPWSRAMAMMHVAMSDAVSSVEGSHARYLASIPSRPGASADVAAATAARIVLSHLFPDQKAAIDAAYATSIGSAPDGSAKLDGIALGEQIAAAVQADRAADGTVVPDTYRPIATPGVWVPTTSPAFAQYAQAKPWVMKSADQFRPGPPPALNSALYARDYNETKSVGGVKSDVRTPAQSDAVKFWTQINLAPAWQDAARQLAAAKGLKLAESARLFALLNMGVANTFINDWDAKFTYNFWRPVTAIRNGDIDGNDATERDPGWTPSNVTPMHPEYPSQAAIISGVAVAIMESVFGPQPAIPFEATDLLDPTKKRAFKSIAEMAAEHENVRVWGGIHFRNSLDVGADMGRKIAAYLIANSLAPAR